MEEVDLKVRVEKPSLVPPAEHTERRSFFLSNFDQMLEFTVETIHFFAPNKSQEEEEEEDYVAQTVFSALSKLLVPYDYMAGRLKLNTEEGRLEIDCNRKGALFAAASSELNMGQLPDITYPNLAFTQLMVQEYDVASLEDLPLLFLQVTRFKCGGFAMGFGINHIVLDGLAMVGFMKNLASVAKGQGLAVVPQPDRSLLRARSPLQITYDHLEFTKVSNIPSEATDLKASSAKLHFNLFPITGDMLGRLKSKAVQQCTSFEALTAHLWKAHTMALRTPPDKISTVLFVVDIRSKMNPPLPKEFAGNALLSGYARATAGELTEAPLSWCVRKVQEGIARLTDDYVKSVGVPCADKIFVVSPWRRLGFEDVEYPWGKPIYSGPVVNRWMDAVLLLPNPTNRKEEGLGVLIGLQDEQQMEKFRSSLFSFNDA